MNRQNAVESERFRDENERFEASLLKNPLTNKEAFAQFGMLLGIFPPMAMFARFIYDNVLKDLYHSDSWLIFLLIFVNFVCAFTGYYSGKLIGSSISGIEKLNLGSLLVVAPFLGILWGVMTGAAGGVFIFIIGAFFGAAVASIVGLIAMPFFIVFHRWLKKGDLVERDQIFPIAMGIALIISAIILGADFP